MRSLTLVWAVAMLASLSASAQGPADAVFGEDSAVNYVPGAGSETILVTSGNPISLSLIGFDANDDPIAFSVIDPPDSGSIASFDASTGVVIYDPDSPLTAVDSFEFRVNDGIADSEPAWILILADSDDDGLADLDEGIVGTNPYDADTDDDGLKDGVETSTGVFVSNSDTGTNPLNPDSDGDGFNDGIEIGAGSNPNSPESVPPISVPSLSRTGFTALVGLLAAFAIVSIGLGTSDSGRNVVFTWLTQRTTRRRK